jgi:hypothetical protein
MQPEDLHRFRLAKSMHSSLCLPHNLRVPIVIDKYDCRGADEVQSLSTCSDGKKKHLASWVICKQEQGKFSPGIRGASIETDVTEWSMQLLHLEKILTQIQRLIKARKYDDLSFLNDHELANHLL